MNEANETLNRSNHQLVQFEILNQAAPPYPLGGCFFNSPAIPTTQWGVSYGSKWGIPTQHPTYCLT